MRFYFCFGILLCFICLIIIPKFSTGMPSSSGSTSNNESDPSVVNNNEQMYPITNYYVDKVKNSVLNLPYVEFFRRCFKIINFWTRSDQPDRTPNELINIMTEALQKEENILKESLCGCDVKNNDTITKKDALKVFTNKKCFKGKLFGNELNNVLNMYTDPQNQVKYKELLKNIVTHIEGYPIEVDNQETNDFIQLSFK
ncbi:uncharacterized protein LOC126901752 [Daktulosphaira vitifoliae]|uniref:uncharacterized protein LOC126901752 n=1 Tax=Daktulosphaira vitifoliae TaxID=58002 RepID=UPI0021AAB129|nr:uncharacterized protein LOC126901752 [Daktulosphaira vitifoliae]